MLRLIVITAFTVLVIPGSAFARQYRCEGKIQYRPCNQKVSSVSPRVTSVRGSIPRSPARHGFGEPKGALASRYAEVTKQEYLKLKDGMGLWKGAVRGNGDVHLQLELVSRGKDPDVRYMGHVPLRGNETTFNFKSVPPPGAGWDWRIRTWAD